ncbi:major capsid protein, partial [Pseudomonas aeruginosa]|uniref:major capsid protein n=1 Tax=Pseudomonas aeruginosa TaxID=287 RepID=UPI002E8E6F4A|nr:major capsid protein [Pseudomonas aeruginosa]
VLSGGRLNVKGEGVDDVIDFQMEDTHKVTLATGKWGTSGADPIGNLRTWKPRIAKDSGRTANVSVFSGEALDAFQNDESVMKKL